MELNQETIKQLFKESLTEALHENRALFEEVFAEVLEDIVLSEAIHQGRKTERVDRNTVFKTLEQAE